MHNLSTVRKALTKSIIQHISAENQDSIISFLIYDTFGGEILKTKSKSGWHFYNRIDGIRLDFSKADFSKTSEMGQIEDIPVSHHEASYYFEPEQYSVFQSKFISFFEETVGLKMEYQIEYAI